MAHNIIIATAIIIAAIYLFFRMSFRANDIISETSMKPLRMLMDAAETMPSSEYPTTNEVWSTNPTDLRNEAGNILIGAPDGQGYAGYLNACADRIEELEQALASTEHSTDTNGEG